MLTKPISLLLAVSTGAAGMWGLSRVALAAPLLAQAVDNSGLGPVGGMAIPGSIGALILFLAYALKEVYKQLADERVACANRITDECKDYARQLQLVYESNKADLARTYSETQDLVKQSNQRQDAANERLMTLIVSQLPNKKGEQP